MRIAFPYFIVFLFPSPVQFTHALPIGRPIAYVPRIATDTGGKPNNRTSAMVMDARGKVEGPGPPIWICSLQSPERSNVIFQIPAIGERTLMKIAGLVCKVW
jgi:hypothetical protein